MITIPKMQIKHGGEVYAEGVAYDLTPALAEYFVRNGWAVDPEGRIKPGKLPTNQEVNPDNGLIGF